MSEQQQTAEATTTETEATTTEQPATATETKPTETVDFWKQKAREQEKRAKENAEAAKRLAEIEEAQKSEAEKSADRLRAAEVERDAALREALRFKVASKHGISDEDADLFLTGSDEETLTKQAERLADRNKPAVTSDSTASGKATAVTEGNVKTTPGLGTLRAAYADAATK